MLIRTKLVVTMLAILCICITASARAGNQWHIDNLVDCLAEAAWHESEIDLSVYDKDWYPDPDRGREGRDERKANNEYNRAYRQAVSKDRILCRQIETALRTAIIKQELISFLECPPWDAK